MVDLERRALLVGAAATVAALRLGATASPRRLRRARCPLTRSRSGWPAAIPPPTGSCCGPGWRPIRSNGGGMPPDPVAVTWEVAADATFATIEATGSVNAVADLAHTVHVEVDGLASGRVLLVPVLGGGVGRAPSAARTRSRWARPTRCGSGSCPARATPAATTPRPGRTGRRRSATSGCTSATTSTRTPAAARRGRTVPTSASRSSSTGTATRSTRPTPTSRRPTTPRRSFRCGTTTRSTTTTRSWTTARARPATAPGSSTCPCACTRPDGPEPADLPTLRVGRPGELPHARRAPVPRPGAVRRRSGRLPGAPRRGPHAARGRAAGVARAEPGDVRRGVGRRRPAGRVQPVAVRRLYNDDQWDGYPQQRDRVWAMLRQRLNPVSSPATSTPPGSPRLHQTLGDVSTPRIGTELVGTSVSSRFDQALIDAAEALINALPYIEYANAGRPRATRWSTSPATGCGPPSRW